MNKMVRKRNRTSLTLAIIHLFQSLSGLAGQGLLLVRWSPNSVTDLYLLTSTIPWLVSSFMLVGGLEVALPAALHKAENNGRKSTFLGQIVSLAMIIGVVGTLISTTIGIHWALESGLNPIPAVWLGAGVGLQFLPSTLSGVARGLLMATDRLIILRSALLVSSLCTTMGYLLLPPPAVFALPITGLVTVLVGFIVTWRASKVKLYTMPRIQALLPEMQGLIRMLFGLGVAAGVIHAQNLLERLVMGSLGIGYISALSVASRAWDSVVALSTTANIMPVYATWAQMGDPDRRLLFWSLRRTLFVSLIASIVGCCVLILLHNLLWTHSIFLSQATLVGLAVIPRFALLNLLQPLVYRYYARGNMWDPVMGSVVGFVTIAIAMLILVPQYRLLGYALSTFLGVIPGFAYLCWCEWNRKL